MRFTEELAAGTFAVALEITPPQKSLPRVLERRAGLLGATASAINVIQRPNRQSSLAASLELQAAGYEPAWHLVTRGRSRDEIAAELACAADADIRQVLCIRGDHDAADGAGTPTLRETITMGREALPGAVFGATFNQYARDQAAALRNLFPKLAAGAAYVQTQPVFVPGALNRAAEAIKAKAPGTAIVAMVMPLHSSDALTRVSARLGVDPPPGLGARLDASAEGAWAAFDETVFELVHNPAIAGVAVMTFEMDPDPAVGPRIVAALRAAGVEA